MYYLKIIKIPKGHSYLITKVPHILNLNIRGLDSSTKKWGMQFLGITSDFHFMQLTVFHN